MLKIGHFISKLKATSHRVLTSKEYKVREQNVSNKAELADCWGGAELADMYKFMKEVGDGVKNTLCQVTRSHSMAREVLFFLPKKYFF